MTLCNNFAAKMGSGHIFGGGWIFKRLWYKGRAHH